MGDAENAAKALSHMPRWVAVHQNTLVKMQVVLENVGDTLGVLDEIDDARQARDRAVSDVLIADMALADPEGGEGESAAICTIPYVHGPHTISGPVEVECPGLPESETHK